MSAVEMFSPAQIFGYFLYIVVFYIGYSGRPVRYILLPFFLSGITSLLLSQSGGMLSSIPAPVFTVLWVFVLCVVLVWYYVLWWIGRRIGRKQED